MRISIIIPVLNEANAIADLLNDLQPLRNQRHQLILVDGGSRDNSVEIARPLVDKLIRSPTGRARQMNAGAAVAHGDLLWFLHADCRVKQANAEAIIHAAHNGRSWGRFDVRLSGKQPLLRVVERMMNLRSCVTGIATGDQGIFVKRELFEQLGSYPELPLMEDIALSRALKKRARPACLSPRLITSSRRWEQKGIIKTILLMWFLRLAFFFGADPNRLQRLYR